MPTRPIIVAGRRGRFLGDRRTRVDAVSVPYHITTPTSNPATSPAQIINATFGTSQAASMTVPDSSAVPSSWVLLDGKLVYDVSYASYADGFMPNFGMDYSEIYAGRLVGWSGQGTAWYFADIYRTLATYTTNGGGEARTRVIPYSVSDEMFGVRVIAGVLVEYLNGAKTTQSLDRVIYSVDGVETVTMFSLGAPYYTGSSIDTLGNSYASEKYAVTVDLQITRSNSPLYISFGNEYGERTPPQRIGIIPYGTMTTERVDESETFRFTATPDFRFFTGPIVYNWDFGAGLFLGDYNGTGAIETVTGVNPLVRDFAPYPHTSPYMTALRRTEGGIFQRGLAQARIQMTDYIRLVPYGLAETGAYLRDDILCGADADMSGRVASSSTTQVFYASKNSSRFYKYERDVVSKTWRLSASDNDGLEWIYMGSPTFDSLVKVARACPLSDGSIAAIGLQPYSRKIYLSVSRDFGETWSDAIDTNITIPSSFVETNYSSLMGVPLLFQANAADSARFFLSYDARAFWYADSLEGEWTEGLG